MNEPFFVGETGVNELLCSTCYREEWNMERNSAWSLVLHDKWPTMGVEWWRWCTPLFCIAKPLHFMPQEARINFWESVSDADTTSTIHWSYILRLYNRCEMVSSFRSHVMLLIIFLPIQNAARSGKTTAMPLLNTNSVNMSLSAHNHNTE